MKIEKKKFAETAIGQVVLLYTLTNSAGYSVGITNYGGIVTSVIVPDKNRKPGNVVLGYDRPDGYLANNPYFGCIIGRYANRIARGKFKLENKTYTLATNHSQHHLHGGIKGFDKQLWDAREIATGAFVGLELHYVSADGEEGYPGKLDVLVRYKWTEQNDLAIEYRAQTDKTTICNLTNHSYFNLKDGGASSILSHCLKIDADRITVVDETLIPTGAFLPVTDTVFDFRQPKAVGLRITASDRQLQYGSGYDHNFVLNGQAGSMRLVASLSEPESGRLLEVKTTEPGLQFYSGNFLNGSICGKGNIIYKQRHGLCLETQHYPDSPNQANFPSTVLDPGQEYKTSTIYSFRLLRKNGDVA